MKKIFRNIFLSFITTAVVAGAFLPYLSVSAQAVGDLQPLDPNSFEAYQQEVDRAANSGLVGIDQNNVSQGGQAAGDASKTPPNGPKVAGCFGFNGIVPVLNLDSCLAWLIYMIMWIVSWILFIAGLILDASLYFTTHMSELLAQSPIVDIGWKIFRDLANICFIFILLWIAIGTIIGINSGKTKELLVHLIAVALLMNFSLFLTKVVIDTSNIVAVHFYNLIVTPNPTGYGSFAGAFMQGLKIQTIYDTASQAGGTGGLAAAAAGTTGRGLVGLGAGFAIGGPVGALVGAGVGAFTTGSLINMGKIILIGIGGSILMINAAYVFFTAAILCIIRIVALVFVMILSPLAFLAYILPSTEKYAEQWWETLINNAMFAPVYLALSYIVIKAIQSPGFQGIMTITTGQTGALSFISGDYMQAAAIIVNFIILIALMLGCILIAKKMETAGHETAIELGKEARGFVGRTIARGTYVSAATTTAGFVSERVGVAAERLGFKDFGKKAKEFGMKTSDAGHRLQKKIDINELDRKFERSGFGTTELGNFVREKTTAGAIFGTGAKFGGEKSVHESYEESEHLRDRAQDVERANDVKRAALELQSEIKNKKRARTEAEILATKPQTLPEVDDGQGGKKQMTEKEWVAFEQKKDKDENKKQEEKIKSLESAVQSAVVRLPSTGLIHLQEEVIETVIPYATEKQVDELMKSTDGGWTLQDKELFVRNYFNKLKEDGEQLQKEMEKYAEELAKHEKLIREGRIEIDKATGKVVTDNKGRAIAAGTTLDQNGNASGATFEIPQPEFEKGEAFKAVYAKTRRYMSNKGFELLNITKFDNYSQETRDRLAKEGKDPDKEGNLLKAIPAIGKIMKWGTVQDIRDPNKTSGFTDQFRVDIRYIKDAELNELLTKLREQKDASGNYMYRNTDTERAEALRTGDFSKLSKDVMWEERMRGFLSGRSANESANTPGGLRKNYEYARFLGAEALREFAKKDPVDVTGLLESAFQAYKENEEGVRMMSVETKQLIKDLIQTKEGWRIGQKMQNAEFQAWRERLERGYREGNQAVTFTDWTDPAQRAAANARLGRGGQGGGTPPAGGGAPAGGPQQPNQPQSPTSPINQPSAPRNVRSTTRYPSNTP